MCRTNTGINYQEVEKSLNVSPGESVTVTVCSTEGETATLLASVLDNNHTAASLLARAIHRDPVTVDAQADALMVPLNPSDLGIWIDPIGERLFNPPAATWSTAEVNNSRFSPRCHQPVHRGSGGGAGGGPPLPFRPPLRSGPDRGLSAEQRRASDGRHQPAVQLQGPSQRKVS